MIWKEEKYWCVGCLNFLCLMYWSFPSRSTGIEGDHNFSTILEGDSGSPWNLKPSPPVQALEKSRSTLSRRSILQAKNHMSETTPSPTSARLVRRFFIKIYFLCGDNVPMLQCLFQSNYIIKLWLTHHPSAVPKGDLGPQMGSQTISPRSSVMSTHVHNPSALRIHSPVLEKQPSIHV